MATSRVLVPLFFAALFLVGILGFSDFGLSWDEKTQYQLGIGAYEAVFVGAEYPVDTGFRFHGASLEILLHLLREKLPLSNVQQIFFMRHFVNFLVFFLGVLCFYPLATGLSKNWRFGLLGCAMLVLSPRIFGHAFFNSRDIPTMVLFILSIWTLLRFLDRRSVGSAVLHGFACGLLLSIRMTGVFLPALTGLMLALEAAQARKLSMRQCGPFLVYFVCAVAFTILLWPLLWTDPLQNFFAAYQYMSTKFAGGFYFGETVGQNPWHWIPVWMFISTPLLYTALFLAGVGSYLQVTLRNVQSFLGKRRNDLIVLLWFFGPILAVILLRAGIFDTWRHVFFVYPAFLLIALQGLQWISLSLRERVGARGSHALWSIVGIGLCMTTFWMVRNHPMQYVYFSIPDTYAEGQFELDYWGLAFREGLEWIVENDSDPVIPINATSSPAFNTINILKAEDRRRLLFTGGIDPEKYVLDNFQSAEYRKIYEEGEKAERYELVHSVDVGGIPVMRVYRNLLWEPYEMETWRIPPETAVAFY